MRRPHFFHADSRHLHFNRRQLPLIQLLSTEQLSKARAEPHGARLAGGGDHVCVVGCIGQRSYGSWVGGALIAFDEFEIVGCVGEVGRRWWRRAFGQGCEDGDLKIRLKDECKAPIPGQLFDLFQTLMNF